MDPASEPSASIAFGRFQVVPQRRELLADGRPVRVGGRAFEVLMALLEARGAVIGKDALMRRAWPGRAIEEHNLQAQISALRKAFGAERGLIRTVSGHGYQFTGEIRNLPESPDERAGAAAPPPTNLPQTVSELIGRDEELGEVLSLAAAHRLITLTGAGGIGKTRLAVAAARRLLPQFADGVWLVEFSPLADPGLVPATVAAALRLDLGGSEVSAPRIAQALAERHLLLVLDTCEHVIDATAALAEAVLQAGAAVHILATSREPLKAEGERIYPVPPLAVPAEEAQDQDDLLRYDAVRLFLERAQATAARFAPDRRVAALIAAICRRLDGIPLAIELAAAHAAAPGIEVLAARFDDLFNLLIGGRRTASPRHRTLRATLDWSHELLSERERMLLRRLSVFAGAFSLEAARTVVASAEISPSKVVEDLFSLVAKSLVMAEGDGPITRYRLLDTTRAYALEKLTESGERERLARRHAEYYRDLFERAESEWEMRPAAEWLADYRRQIDNLRAVLDWTFSPGGDAALGVALTAAAVPLWMHLPLLDECRGRAEQALAAVAAGAGRDARREMKLHAARAASLIYTRGAVSESGTVWAKVFEIAESLGDAEYRLRSLLGLWFFHTAGGRHRAALSLAQRLHAPAANRHDPNDRMVGERMIGISQHYLGNQKSARRHIERALAHYLTSDHRSPIIRFVFDQRVMARVFLARILWLQGFPDQAMRAAHSSVEDARGTSHAMSLCYALSQAACPITLLAGDLAATEDYVGMLLDHSARHALALWQAWGRCHQGVLSITRGDVVTGLRLLRRGLDELGRARFATLRLIAFPMAEALGRAGWVADGLAAIGEALAWAERSEERWLMAELLRVKGELVLSQSASGAAATAADHFRQALALARRQGALSWELRAAVSLARLRRVEGRCADARALLQPVYDRFTEGFATADLKAARALLAVTAET